MTPARYPAMHPQATFKADVLLVAPKEHEVTRTQRSYREKSFTSFTERLDAGGFQKHYIRRINEAIGLEALSAYLNAAGIRVAVVNCNVAPHTPAQIVDKIRRSGARVVGISLIYRPQVAQALDIVAALANVPDVHVCLGGVLASFMMRFLLARLGRVDAVVFGEAEETFRDHVEAVLGDRDWRALEGVAFRDARRVIVNPAARPLDLARVLPPTRQTLSYLQTTGRPTPIASLYTSRGCMARCTFCTGKDAYNVERKRTYRFRDPVHVVDEIQELHERFGVSFVYFNDDNFLGYGKPSRARIRTLAEEIVSRRLSIQFASECRVDALDPELLALLKEAGLIQVLLGLESGSDRTLKRWRKGATVAHNKAAIATMQQVGISVEPGFIMFDAHTTQEELSENLHFIRDTGLERTPFPTYLVNRLSVYPNSDIEAVLVEEGVIQPSSVGLVALPGENPGAVLAEFERLDYVCLDRRTEIVWRSLRWALEPVEQCIEDALPALTAALQAIRKHSHDPAAKQRAVALVRAAAAWRRRLGKLVTRMLEAGIESYAMGSHAAQFRWLRRRLRAIRTDYETSTLGTSMAQFLDDVVALQVLSRAEHAAGAHASPSPSSMA